MINNIKTAICPKDQSLYSYIETDVSVLDAKCNYICQFKAWTAPFFGIDVTRHWESFVILGLAHGRVIDNYINEQEKRLLLLFWYSN